MELRKAAKAEEAWYRDLAEGDCRGLDAFLQKRGMSVLDMAELPSEDELLQPWEFDVQTSKKLKAERGRGRGRKRRRQGAEEKQEAQQRGESGGSPPKSTQNALQVAAACKCHAAVSFGGHLSCFREAVVNSNQMLVDGCGENSALHFFNVAMISMFHMRRG